MVAGTVCVGIVVLGSAASGRALVLFRQSAKEAMGFRSIKSVRARNITLGRRLFISPAKKLLNPAIHRPAQMRNKNPFHIILPTNFDTPSKIVSHLFMKISNKVERCFVLN